MSGVVMGVTAVAATAANIYASNKQAKAQKAAMKAQVEASNKQLAQQKEQYNRSNQKQADITTVLEQNTAGDLGTTMLTGATGVDKNQYQLGKGSTLLGD